MKTSLYISNVYEIGDMATKRFFHKCFPVWFTGHEFQRGLYFCHLPFMTHQWIRACYNMLILLISSHSTTTWCLVTITITTCPFPSVSFQLITCLLHPINYLIIIFPISFFFNLWKHFPSTSPPPKPCHLMVDSSVFQGNHSPRGPPRASPGHALCVNGSPPPPNQENKQTPTTVHNDRI